MDVGSVTSTLTLEAIVSAWSEAMTAEVGAEHAVPGSAMAQAPNGAATSLPITAAGFVEGAADTHHLGAAAAAPAHLPGSRADHGPESATLQTFARPHAPAAEAQRPAETALPTAAHAHSEFAIPAAQLLPVSLVGLQVEHAAGWPFPYQPACPMPPPETVRATLPETPAFEADAGPGVDGDEPETPHDRHGDDTESSADGWVFDEPDTAAWCEPLTRTLREALATKLPPQALLVAADQWQRGRCVVLACPQGADPAGPAWAFVLWPRRTSRAVLRNERAHRAPSLTLFGLRVEATLQWATPPQRVSWCHVRVVKEHHPRRGRQLVSPDRGDAAGGPMAPVPCEVQLGPVLARSLRRCEVCIRINAVRRFWAALGGQWSVNLVVSSVPLAPSRQATLVEAAC